MLKLRPARSRAVRVEVELLRAGRTESVSLESGATGFDLFKRLMIAPDAHLLVRGDAPLPLDEPLREGDRVTVVSVVSGG